MLRTTQSHYRADLFIEDVTYKYRTLVVNTHYVQAEMPFKTKIRSCHIRHRSNAALLNFALTKHYHLTPQLWPIKTTDPSNSTSDKRMCDSR